jgi:hypothetical protein
LGGDVVAGAELETPRMLKCFAGDGQGDAQSPGKTGRFNDRRRAHDFSNGSGRMLWLSHGKDQRCLYRFACECRASVARLTR